MGLIPRGILCSWLTDFTLNLVYLSLNSVVLIQRGPGEKVWVVVNTPLKVLEEWLQVGLFGMLLPDALSTFFPQLVGQTSHFQRQCPDQMHMQLSYSWPPTFVFPHSVTSQVKSSVMIQECVVLFYKCLLVRVGVLSVWLWELAY